MNIRLLRWVILHVFFASVPILSALTVYAFFLDPQQAAQVHHGKHAGEVLFFTFMVSSIACSEVVELIYRYKVSEWWTAWLAVWLFAGAVWSSWLYFMTVQYTILNPAAVDAGQRVWKHSLLLAAVFLVFGTTATVMYGLVENGTWRLEPR